MKRKRIQNPDLIKVTLGVNPRLHRIMSEQARQEGRSIAEIIRRAVEEYATNHPIENPIPQPPRVNIPRPKNAPKFYGEHIQ